MQIGIGISSAFHAALLGWALFSVSAPESLEVADVEAVPVSIVPFEDLTQVVRGEEDASAKIRSAPKPTEPRPKVEDAQNIGQNKVDLKPTKIPVPSETEVIAKAPPKSESKPEPLTQSAPERAKVEHVKPEPPKQSAPATEIAALPQEAAPVRSDPVAEAINTTEPVAEKRVKLPKTGPVPIFRDQVAPAQTAKTPDRKKENVAKTKPASSRSSDFNSDEIASLLNRQDSQGGGALTSQRKEGLGAETSSSAAKLSQSEMDALRGQIQDKWNIIPGLADGGEIRITVSMQLDRAGNIIGQPDVVATGGSASTRQTLAGSARRAVLRAQPYNLPSEKYDTWSNVKVNFDPSELF